MLAVSTHIGITNKFLRLQIARENAVTDQITILQLVNPNANRLKALAYHQLTLCYASYGLDIDANAPKWLH